MNGTVGNKTTTTTTTMRYKMMVVLSFIHGSASSWLVTMRHESKAESFHHSSQRTEDCGIDLLEASMHGSLFHRSCMQQGIRFSICTDTHTAFMPHTSSSTQTSNRDTQHHCLHCFVPSTYLSMVLSCLFADRMNPCNTEK